MTIRILQFVIYLLAQIGMWMSFEAFLLFTVSMDNRSAVRQEMIPIPLANRE